MANRKPNSPSPNPLTPIPSPKIWPDANARLVIGAGAPIDPIVRLNTFSAGEFENFTNQWIHDSLSKKYDAVEERHGAGDKGRDIVAWIDQKGTKNRRWDNYQCKHYSKPLAPTDVYIELGKLCFYTFRKDFTIPESYYFVCNNGIGTTLADLIQNPVDLRQKLIENWTRYCEKEITNTQAVPLTSAFKDYVENFDFSIVDQIPPLTMIKMHAKTRYHDLTFGTSLSKRPAPLLPPKKVHKKETRYIAQLFEAYSDHLQTPVVKEEDLKSYTREDLPGHFLESRQSFYSAESLKEFARDNLPPQEDWFGDLCQRIHTGIKSTLRKAHRTGYERLLNVTEIAGTVQIGQHVLDGDLLPGDRIGICHQLANEDKVKWVQK